VALKTLDNDVARRDLDESRVFDSKEEAELVGEIGLKWQKEFACILQQFCAAAVKQDEWTTEEEVLTERMHKNTSDLNSLDRAIYRARIRVTTANAAADAAALDLARRASSSCVWG
jgi:hypothetical protein